MKTPRQTVHAEFPEAIAERQTDGNWHIWAGRSTLGWGLSERAAWRDAARLLPQTVPAIKARLNPSAV